VKNQDKLTGSVCAALVCAMSLLPAAAELTVASPFTDNAVLQRELPVPVWGTADAGATVTVEFAGQLKEAVADSSNHWKVILDPMAASSNPWNMTVSSSIGNQQSVISNVVVGEVWICSGQSNMQMGYKNIPDVAALLPFTKNIRTFEVPRTVAFTEQKRCEGTWMDEPPNSAVALAFAFFWNTPSTFPLASF
jgi:sialate O-acetylesterase